MKAFKYTVMAVSLAALGGLATTAAEAKSSKDNLKVGIFSFNYASPVNHLMVTRALADCETRGWTCEVFDGKGDPVATSNGAINFINRDFDALVNIISDNKQLSSVIKAANAANIPYVSTFAGDASGITADISASGTIQGALVGDELRSAMDLSGRVVILNWNVLPVLRERSRAVNATVADDKNIEVTEIELMVPGYIDDAYNKLTAFLQGNKDVKAVVLGWGELAPAAIRAIEQNGMSDQIKVYTYDANPDVIELIRKGSPLKMVVGFGSEEMAEMALKTVADVIDGNAPRARSLMVRSCVFTRENIPPAGQQPDFKNCTPFTAEIPVGQ